MVSKVISWIYTRARVGIFFRPLKHKTLKIIVSILPITYRYRSSWFWDRIGGAEYQEKALYNRRHYAARLLLEQGLKQIKFNSILEVGCGTGDNLDYIKKLYPSATVVGCDYSKKQIDCASQYQGIQFDIADAGKLPYESNSFDVVVTIGCLAHIPPSHILNCTKELQRVSKNYLFLFEEDKQFTNPLTYEISSRSGWHFYHDYEKLFNQNKIEYCGNNMGRLDSALHTHVYRKKGYAR